MPGNNGKNKKKTPSNGNNSNNQPNNPQNNGNNSNNPQNNENNSLNNGNNQTLPIVKIDTKNKNKKGKIQNSNTLIVTEEGQIPYMCIIS